MKIGLAICLILICFQMIEGAEEKAERQKSPKDKIEGKTSTAEGEKPAGDKGGDAAPNARSKRARLPLGPRANEVYADSTPIYPGASQLGILSHASEEESLEMDHLAKINSHLAEKPKTIHIATGEFTPVKGSVWNCSEHSHNIPMNLGCGRYNHVARRGLNASVTLYRGLTLPHFVTAFECWVSRRETTCHGTFYSTPTIEIKEAGISSESCRLHDVSTNAAHSEYTCSVWGRKDDTESIIVKKITYLPIKGRNDCDLGVEVIVEGAARCLKEVIDTNSRTYVVESINSTCPLEKAMSDNCMIGQMEENNNLKTVICPNHRAAYVVESNKVYTSGCLEEGLFKSQEGFYLSIPDSFMSGKEKQVVLDKDRVGHPKESRAYADYSSIISHENALVAELNRKYSECMIVQEQIKRSVNYFLNPKTCETYLGLRDSIGIASNDVIHVKSCSVTKVTGVKKQKNAKGRLYATFSFESAVTPSNVDEHGIMCGNCSIVGDLVDLAHEGSINISSGAVLIGKSGMMEPIKERLKEYLSKERTAEGVVRSHAEGILSETVAHLRRNYKTDYVLYGSLAVVGGLSYWCYRVAKKLN